MKRTLALAAAACVIGFAGLQPVAAQQPSEEEMMAAWQEAMAVGPEHEALAARAGTWAITTTYMMPGADHAAEDHAVVERTVTMDGRVLQESVQGTMMGMPFAGEGRTGFDNVTERYWSTWTDTTSTQLFVMHGDFDAATGTYTYEGNTVDPLMGEMTMRIEWTIDGPDQETAVFFADYPGQGMTQIMQMIYERQ